MPIDQSAVPRHRHPTLGDSMELTKHNQRLQEVEHNIANLSDVDKARVAEIRQALANGTFTIDIDKIAQKIFEIESQR